MRPSVLSTVLALLVLLPDLASADDARRLRLEAGVLVQAAEAADTARERRKLLEEAHGKLLEILERHPSESTRLNLYFAAGSVTLTMGDLEAMIAGAPFADVGVGDAGRLRAVLGRSLSPFAVDENGWTDLHWAAALNLPDLAAALLDAGASAEARLKDDGKPLGGTLSQSLQEFGLAEVLGVDLADLLRDGSTPLHYAAWGNASDAAALLVERGADVNAKSGNDTTPLHYAASGNALDAVALLLDRGADINAKNAQGGTLLHFAAYGNASDAAALLVGRGADVNAKDSGRNAPLHYAAWGNASDVAALLVERGADISARNAQGRTPLALAEENDAPGVAALLRELQKNN